MDTLKINDVNSGDLAKIKRRFTFTPKRFVCFDTRTNEGIQPMKEKLTVGREGKNLMPSKADQRAYLKKIRDAADGGDVMAMAAILGLARLDDLLKAAPSPSASGWVGDADDPGDQIRATIRANDPSSKQLPENQ